MRIFRSIVETLVGPVLDSRQERSLSVMIRLGGMPAFFSSLMSNRLAAFVSRRL